MIFGEPRVPFERPVQGTAGYVPRTLDTGFIPEIQAFPQIMPAVMARMPAGVHLPLSAEPGGTMPAANATAVAAAAAPQPPSANAIKQKSMGMMSIPLMMAIGIFPSPRSGGIHGGLNPSRLVQRGRNPGA